MDELDKLSAALKAAPPADDAARHRAVTLAMENFDRLQGSTASARPTEDRPLRTGFFNGVRQMFKLFSSKPALAATTSVAALVVGLAVILPVTESSRPSIPPAQPKLTSPVPAQGRAIDPATSAVAPMGLSEADTAPAEAIQPLATEMPAPADAAADAVSVSPVTDEPETASNAAPPTPAAAAEEAATSEAKQMAPAAGEIAVAGIMAESAETRLRMPMDAPAPAADQTALPAANTEAYATAEANPVQQVAEAPVSTFSTDVDTASWSVIRSSLNAGQMPLPEQVRVEEMVNYFPYAYAAPEGDAPFATTLAVMPTPWNPNTRLVAIGLQGALPDITHRPPLNLVFLIDTSGSMEDANKLGLLKQSLALMLPELRPEDQIAIVAYAGSAGEVLPPTSASERGKILAALESLSAGGATAGAEGIELAYRIAAEMAGAGEVTRVLLATDGDFNIGIAEPDALERLIAEKRDQGSYLSVLGFGRGNLDDATMQALAQNGNGTASYIDTLSEARKVLVDQLTGALFPLADDVKVQVEWNPAAVAEYRLIGYETRALRREDFNNDKVDAGEIGAGLQVTALYEVAAPGSKGLLNDPLHYGEPPVVGGASDELGFLRLRWKAPGSEVSQLIEAPISASAPTSDETRFAAAVAGFGQLLQGSVYLGDWSWQQAIDLAASARGSDAFGYRSEAVTLMRLAQSLSK